MKTHNFDIILFFKVGKFYELYHMDAVVAANELNLTFMRVRILSLTILWAISIFNADHFRANSLTSASPK